MITIPHWLCLAAITQAILVFGDFISTDYDEYNDGKFGHRPHLEFHCSRDFAPVLQVNKWNKTAVSKAGSHIFLRHDGNSSCPLSSPLILDADDLSAVYINRTFKNVFGTRVQENFGKKYLTFWEGKKGDGIGDGYGLAYDDTYRLMYKVSAQNLAVHGDLHEFQLTGLGTALVTGVNKVEAVTKNWEGWMGQERYLMLDSIFQEIDLETNEVRFTWRALDHISPMDSFEPLVYSWDPFHLNSIQKTQAGNYLISFRHMHSICLVDGKSGNIIWTLGGKQNEFTELPPADGADPTAPVLTMGWQHHARYIPGTNETQMTLFDNHVKSTTHGQCTADCSRGLHIAIDDSALPPTVQLLREFLHPSNLQAESQGSIQPLSPSEDDIGNVVVGWGRCPAFTEHTSTGETVLDVQFSPWHSPEIPDALDNYRVYKMDWTATPWWNPVIALRENTQGEKIAYACWNGATEVKEWVVRGSVSNDANVMVGRILARSSRTGFETKLTMSETSLRYVWAEALDKQGEIIRRSEVLDTKIMNISIVDESQEINSTFLVTGPISKSFELEISTTTLGAGLGVVVLAVAASIVTWRRREEYRPLEGEDSDSDLGLEDDVVLDLGFDDASYDSVPELLQNNTYTNKTRQARSEEKNKVIRF